MKLAVDLFELELEQAFLNVLKDILKDPKLSSVWPALENHNVDGGEDIPSDEIEIVVVPLDRIGAPAGASGARVFIAYYTHVPTKETSLTPSPPLVVKLQRGMGKLVEECKAADAWPKLDDKVTIRFAKPLKHQSVGEWDVLVAPFRSVLGPISKGNRHQIRALDLWSKIYKGPKEIGTSISAALNLVSKAHQAGNGRKKRVAMQYGKEYEWYLRNTHGPEGNMGRAYATIEQVFGASEMVQMFGHTWPNPNRLISKVLSWNFTGTRGAIHGDLHPKNIVFDEDGLVYIIDFGWAKKNAHVVADYVLLDINLRSMTLPAQIAEEDIVAAANYLYPTDAPPKVPDLLQERLSIIKEQIWGTACNNEAVNSDKWHDEYVVPFFIVAYGLLVHLDSARNQRALVATVLGAAKRIEKKGLL